MHKTSNTVWRDRGPGAWATEDCRKLLLTATPLQNSLLELYGLSTLIDERLYVPSFALGYWLTNVLGFVLLHKGVAGMLSTRKASLKRDLLIATAYIVQRIARHFKRNHSQVSIWFECDWLDEYPIRSERPGCLLT